jgi:hypothetical protein
LENQIKNLEKSFSTKCSENKVIVEKKIVYLKNQTINENKFPNLTMKAKSNQTQAASYRLNKNAKIYDGVNGNVLEKWEEKTSFTSNFKSGDWIKVTGYFVNQIWQRSSRELWIKAQDANQRE